MNSAVLSECGNFRYRLERDVQDDGIVFAFFGVNPSTADALKDDATVRKWRGFTKRNGGRKFIVGNLFAYRATDPKGLLLPADCIGPLQQQHISEIIEGADVLVPCWGNLSKMPKQLRRTAGEMMSQLLAAGKPVLHFGKTKSGDPMHPLTLSYDTKLEPWLND